MYKPKDARDTRFHLYTKRNPHKGQELMIGNKKSLLLSSFNPELPIKFIISGWLDNRFFAKWVRMAIQSLLLHGDYNVIYVSWRSIKELFVAAMMIKLFSADLAQFIIFLKVSIYIIIIIIIIMCYCYHQIQYKISKSSPTQLGRWLADEYHSPLASAWLSGRSYQPS